MLKATELKKDILTHVRTPVGPLPPVLDPDGVYPYQSFCETSARLEIRENNFIELEKSAV